MALYSIPEAKSGFPRLLIIQDNKEVYQVSKPLGTDLQPEVGAEPWPSFEVSGLAGWEGFLGLAESAQL